jgi:transposase-like protein
MGRKGYPAEFRRRALDLVAAGKTVAEVARLLEVSDLSIYGWRRQEQIDRGELPGLSSAEREELRAATLRIRALETELAAHRRATELLKESVRPKRRFEAIAVIASEGLPVEVACRVLVRNLPGPRRFAGLLWSNDREIHICVRAGVHDGSFGPRFLQRPAV